MRYQRQMQLVLARRWWIQGFVRVRQALNPRWRDGMKHMVAALGRMSKDMQNTC